MRTHLSIYGILNSSNEEKEAALWTLCSSGIGNMLQYKNMDIREILFPFAIDNGISPTDHNPESLINLL